MTELNQSLEYHLRNIETERLLLRAITHSDAEALLSIWSDEKTMYYTDTDPINTLEEIGKEIDFMENLYRNGHGNRWGIFKKSNLVLIGTCGFHKWDKQAHSAEVGYEIGSAFWRQGYMNEIFNDVLEYGFMTMQLNRIEAPVLGGNERSMNLLKKFGFREEGRLRERIFKNGKFWDEHYLSLLKKDWRGNLPANQG